MTPIKPNTAKRLGLRPPTGPRIVRFPLPSDALLDEWRDWYLSKLIGR